MKINGSHRPHQMDTVRNRKSPPKDSAGQSNATERSEQVQLSSQASRLAEARAPEVPDQSRVERLKGAIRNGQFKVDVEAIAGRMMAEER